jgi:hypothetical protein
MAAWTRDLEKLQKQIDDLKTIVATQGQQIHDLLVAASALGMRIEAVIHGQVRVTVTVLDSSVTASIPLAGGTLFSIITEIQEGQSPSSTGSIAVGRDVVTSNASKLGPASFSCDGPNLRSAGTIGSKYRVIFVSQP